MTAVGATTPEVLSTQVRVLIIDDHPLFRDGIARALSERLEIELVGEMGSGAEGLEAIRRLVPDVALIDLQLPDMDGIDVVDLATTDGLPTRMVIVSAYQDSATVYRALACGARGYVLKVCSASDLIDAVLAVAAGETVIAPELQAGLVDEIRCRRHQPPEPALTVREIEVLQLAAEGLTATLIAERLFLGVPTVKSHLQHAYAKLQATDRASAVAAALRRGLLS